MRKFWIALTACFLVILAAEAAFAQAPQLKANWDQSLVPSAPAGAPNFTLADVQGFVYLLQAGSGSTAKQAILTQTCAPKAATVVACTAPLPSTLMPLGPGVPLTLTSIGSGGQVTAQLITAAPGLVSGFALTITVIITTAPAP